MMYKISSTNVYRNSLKVRYGKQVAVAVGIRQRMRKNFSLWPTYTWKYWLETRKANVADYNFMSNDAKQSKKQVA